MLKIRVVKTASNAQAVQVISYYHNDRQVIKHFGSCHNKEELGKMLFLAIEWIKDYTGQTSLFPEDNPNMTLHLEESVFLGVHYNFFYNLIQTIQKEIGLETLTHSLLGDLVKIRIFEPASKLRSIDLLENYFGIKHNRKKFYKIAPDWLNLKEEVENIVVNFAKKRYDFCFDIVFYDVTTLYFETFEEDELRKNGFSKDNKSQQPQILMGLIVSKEGFPVAYDIFAGNTFEGHTILPLITGFIQKHSVNSFTVVADAAMISQTNIEELKKSDLNYIVGARLGNLSDKMIDLIDNKLNREDGAIIRIKSDHSYLICSYSSVRYRKDKYEMEKQIEKAKTALKTPAKIKKLKFIKSTDKKAQLNETLIEKTKKLLGIKGYYTNLEEKEISNQAVIEHYHELYRIEQAFRISKNDLQTRPIFHYKEEPIKLHILICFMALVISKHIELTTGDSIKKFVTECKKITDARILNQITGKEVTMRVNLSPKAKSYEKIFLPH
ncbi:MAG TPA: IS1634 family transposase [Bacteroidales bacterium]|nr:IS1634 family transposase [Bacteroidales bacterium]